MDAFERNADAMREFMARAVLFQDAVARSGGLNGTDLQAVGLLLSDGPATPGELAERIGLSAGGSITSLIDRLERAGYVERRRDAVDRRRVLVTAVEERILSAVGPVYAKITAEWTAYLETLDPAQVEFATELLTRAAAINKEATDALRRG